MLASLPLRPRPICKEGARGLIDPNTCGQQSSLTVIGAASDDGFLSAPEGCPDDARFQYLLSTQCGPEWAPALLPQLSRSRIHELMYGILKRTNGSRF